MKKNLMLAIMAALVTTVSACSSEISPTEENCKIGNINEVAMKHGVEKAVKLSESCIKKGYDDSIEWVKERKEQAENFGESIKNKGERLVEDVKNKSEQMSDGIQEKSSELRKKGEEIKNTVVDFSNETVEKGKGLVNP